MLSEKMNERRRAKLQKGSKCEESKQLQIHAVSPFHLSCSARLGSCAHSGDLRSQKRMAHTASTQIKSVSKSKQARTVALKASSILQYVALIDQPLLAHWDLRFTFNQILEITDQNFVIEYLRSRRP
jgi:cobalamin-dependent methionine synthase I